MQKDTSRGDGAAQAAGVRTFLIADVRGYTRYSDVHGDEAASALSRRFAAITGDAMRARGGELIELRGDEALCVFASARAAVRGAIELQRRVRERRNGEPAFPLGVGIGLDVGEAIPTAGGYRGRALNVAARLCSLAKGGEILASEAVAHLAGQDDEAGYAPRRPATVKGVAEPIRFVEIVPKVELPPPPPAPSPEPRRPRRRSVLLMGAGLLVAAGLALAAVQLSDGGDANPPRQQTIASDRCSAVYYERAGSPELLIAADLPLQPGALATTSPMVDAMTLALERHGYRAGPYSVGLQVCDDAEAGGDVPFDEEVCLANAREYVETPSVIGVVGPFASGCAMLEIPILNRAPGGPVAVVSPSNTYVGLTRSTPGAATGEPGRYYPTRERNYARVIPADDVQAAANAIVARRLGVKRVYVFDRDPNSAALAADFVRAARRLGIAIAGAGSWAFGESGDAQLAAVIARTRADGVFLAGPSDPDSGRLLQTLRARLGRAVQFMASDGFDPDTALLAGAAAEGMTISQPGPPSEDLGAEGDDFVAAFSKKFGREPVRFAIHAAQAIDVLVDAIARSDGTRASVTRNLFTTRISNGILGSFWITPTGDTALNTVAIHRIVGGEVTTFATVAVPDALVAPE